LERTEAINKITQLVGKDLRLLATKYNITVFKGDKKNKGWAGHVIERCLDLPLNSAQSPNFGSWELKTICLKHKRNGELTVKETMAITMIDPCNVARTEFENSHLLSKMKK
jgi:DNA mismatch repair protein MutH